MVEFNTAVTGAGFVAIIVLGVGGLIAAPIPMTTETILMMVAPSMVVFGLICLGLGVKYGEHRSRAA